MAAWELTNNIVFFKTVNKMSSKRLKITLEITLDSRTLSVILCWEKLDSNVTPSSNGSFFLYVQIYLMTVLQILYGLQYKSQHCPLVLKLCQQHAGFEHNKPTRPPTTPRLDNFSWYISLYTFILWLLDFKTLTLMPKKQNKTAREQNHQPLASEPRTNSLSYSLGDLSSLLLKCLSL